MSDQTPNPRDLWLTLIAVVRDLSSRLPAEQFRELVLRGVETGWIGHRALMVLVGPALEEQAAASRLCFVFDGSPDGEVTP